MKYLTGREKITILAILLSTILAILIIRHIGSARRYEEMFVSKTWYYSLDGGNKWMERAEPGLKKFDSESNPVHQFDQWGTGKWLDENTILWRSLDGQEAIWKAFDESPY
jgi:hypothetical protein